MTSIDEVSEEMYKNTKKQAKKFNKKLPRDIKDAYIGTINKPSEGRTAEQMYKGRNIENNTYFEPKKNNRWKLIFPKKFNLPEWVVKATERPSYPFNNCKFKVILYDPITPSTTNTLIKLVDGNDGIKLKRFKLKLQMLDPTGVVVEKWKLLDCVLNSIEWNPLDYSDDGISLVTLTITCNNVKIK